MNKVLALVATIVCTQAITVHLESQTEAGFKFLTNAINSVVNTVEKAADDL